MSQGKQIYYHNLRENIRNMNPRFKELAVQAGAYEDGGTVLTGPMDIAKFAELIVAECADIARDHLLDKADRSFLIHKQIKQHFGVE